MHNQYEYTVETVSRSPFKTIENSVRLPLFDCIRLIHFKDLDQSDIVYRELIQEWVQTGIPTNTYSLNSKNNKELILQKEIDKRIECRIKQECGVTGNPNEKNA